VNFSREERNLLGFIVLPARGREESARVYRLPSPVKREICSGLSSSQPGEKRNLLGFIVFPARRVGIWSGLSSSHGWKKRDLVRFLINLAWEERNLVRFIFLPPLGGEEPGQVYRPPTPWSGSCCTRMDPPQTPPPRGGLGRSGDWERS